MHFFEALICQVWLEKKFYNVARSLVWVIGVFLVELGFTVHQTKKTPSLQYKLYGRDRIYSKISQNYKSWKRSLVQ